MYKIEASNSPVLRIEYKANRVLYFTLMTYVVYFHPGQAGSDHCKYNS